MLAIGEDLLMAFQIAINIWDNTVCKYVFIISISGVCTKYLKGNLSHNQFFKSVTLFQFLLLF